MTLAVATNVLVLALSACSLAAAWLANRQTTLRHALYWTWAAWYAWGATCSTSILLTPSAADSFRYLALSLTSCAGVAVLGARRPGVGAWNFVVVGLLVVLLLPLAEGAVAGGALHLAGPRILFLGGTLAVIVLNYLPTRLGAAAVCLGFGCLLQLLFLAGPATLIESLRDSEIWLMLPVTSAIILGHYGIRQARADRSEFDAVWLDFRDRYGVLWGQRMREQFNRSAVNADWPVYLRWQGLRLHRGASLPDAMAQAEMVSVLRALLQRFRAEEYSGR